MGRLMGFRKGSFVEVAALILLYTFFLLSNYRLYNGVCFLGWVGRCGGIVG